MPQVTDESEITHDEDKSEFNAGIAALMRLHEIKKWLDALTDTTNYLTYIKYLKMFYKELRPMMVATKRKVRDDEGGYKLEDISERDRQDQQYNKAQQIRYNIFNGEKPTRIDIEFLEQWEFELRDIDQQRDMNIPRRSDMRFSLSSRR